MDEERIVSRFAVPLSAVSRGKVTSWLKHSPLLREQQAASLIGLNRAGQEVHSREVRLYRLVLDTSARQDVRHLRHETGRLTQNSETLQKSGLFALLRSSQSRSIDL